MWSRMSFCFCRSFFIFLFVPAPSLFVVVLSNVWQNAAPYWHKSTPFFFFFFPHSALRLTYSCFCFFLCYFFPYFWFHACTREKKVIDQQKINKRPPPPFPTSLSWTPPFCCVFSCCLSKVSQAEEESGRGVKKDDEEEYVTPAWTLIPTKAYIGLLLLLFDGSGQMHADKRWKKGDAIVIGRKERKEKKKKRKGRKDANVLQDRG